MKVYFENLNAIRFVAASLVIFHHIELVKAMFQLPNFNDNTSFLLIGKLGVLLFFVLSGFLITYLLFKEQEVTKTINVKYFYIRRILRIWPLYFLIILLALFVFPSIGFLQTGITAKEMIWDQLGYKLLFFILFLPQVVLTGFGVVPYASQTWSIGVEEQFYLIWPWLVKKVKNKMMLFWGVILFYQIIKYLCRFLGEGEYIMIFRETWEITVIDCMAIGGIFALIIYDESYARLREFVFNKIVQWITLLAVLLLIVKGYRFYYFHNDIYSILFGILICNFAANKNRIFSMENILSNYLGKISYGLYIYHSIAIVIGIKLLKNNGDINNYLLYPLIFALTIIFSAISYEFFEKRFIKRKINYSKIISGDSAKLKNR